MVLETNGKEYVMLEYVASVDRCDREQDYKTAWKFLEEKYGKGRSDG